MTDDRELLELAAKAAGITGNYTEMYYKKLGAIGEVGIHDKEKHTMWNPLVSDGDAFRLMVQLGLVVGICYELMTIEVIFTDNTDATIDDFGMDDDIASLVRRAIVRAAAEIGRTL